MSVIGIGLISVGLSLTLASTATAGGTNGTDCWNPGEPLIGPDLIFYDVLDVSNYTSENGIEAYSLGQGYCNIGSQNVQWIDNSPFHPVIGSNMFRLKNGRFEHIGQSWIKFAFTALTQNACGCGCNGQGGTVLGVGCSNPYCCGLTGSQPGLGPKHEINAFTAEFQDPPSSPPYSGSIARRLQVKISDLDPAQNGGGLYFAELQAIASDDNAAGNGWNNASHRPINIAFGTWNASFAGPTRRELPAIRAWKANDPQVVEAYVQVPEEGRFILAAKATDLGDGIWNYEYAFYNYNSHRSAGLFSIPLPQCAVVENIGFHDVDYHSGEPYDGTDWPGSVAGGTITWSTAPYDVNPNANALRWGTLYNFRFDANLPPTTGDAYIGLFRPGSPESVTVETVVPTFIPFGDVAPSGGNGIIDVDDLLCVLEGFMAAPSCPMGDLHPCGGDGDLDVDDITVALDAFAGLFACPHPCPP